MFQQDFDAHTDEDEAACQFGACFVFSSEYTADFNAEHGKNEGRAANQRDSKPSDTCSAPKETPAAKASMLVAMANSSIVFISIAGSGNSSW